jgi:LmbE family N-acetylglucosaminyl deacetylase
MKERVLAIGAHPDDMEMISGGAIAKLAARGYKVTIASMVSGSFGSLTMTPEETAKVRVAEAKRGAQILGGHYRLIGIAEDGVYPREDVIAKVVELIRSVRADIVLTHAPTDYHPAHINTSHAVTWAVFWAGVRKFGKKLPEYSPKRVYYCDNDFGLDFQPDIWVDISETAEVKRRAIAAHHSQIDWMKQHHKVNMVEDAMTLSRIRGLQSGVTYAEAFRQVRKHMQLRAVSLLPV